jgi:hypothetical protein
MLNTSQSIHLRIASKQLLVDIFLTFYYRDEEEEFLRMAAVDRQRVEQERIALQDQLDEVCCRKSNFAK